MLSLFKRDHFILGYTANGILYIKNGNITSFDSLKSLGYDRSKAIDRHNNLFEQAPIIKVTHFTPLRKNLFRAPMFTVVCDSPLAGEEVEHLFIFCHLMGGVNTTISHVTSVSSFIEKPNVRLVIKNYAYANRNFHRS